jgi:hypothetical protein
MGVGECHVERSRPAARRLWNTERSREGRESGGAQCIEVIVVEEESEAGARWSGRGGVCSIPAGEFASEEGVAVVGRWRCDSCGVFLLAFGIGERLNHIDCIERDVIGEGGSFCLEEGDPARVCVGGSGQHLIGKDVELCHLFAIGVDSRSIGRGDCGVPVCTE